MHTSHIKLNTFSPSFSSLMDSHTHNRMPRLYCMMQLKLFWNLLSELVSRLLSGSTSSRAPNTHMQYCIVITLFSDTKVYVITKWAYRGEMDLWARRVVASTTHSWAIDRIIEGVFRLRQISQKMGENECRLSRRRRWYRQVSSTNSYPYMVQKSPSKPRNTPPDSTDIFRNLERKLVLALCASLYSWVSKRGRKMMGYTLKCTHSPYRTYPSHAWGRLSSTGCLPSPRHTFPQPPHSRQKHQNMRAREMLSQLPRAVKQMKIGLQAQSFRMAGALLLLLISQRATIASTSKPTKKSFPAQSTIWLRSMSRASRGVQRQVWRKQGEAYWAASVQTLQSMSVPDSCCLPMSSNRDMYTIRATRRATPTSRVPTSEGLTADLLMLSQLQSNLWTCRQVIEIPGHWWPWGTLMNPLSLIPQEEVSLTGFELLSSQHSHVFAFLKKYLAERYRKVPQDETPKKEHQIIVGVNKKQIIQQISAITYVLGPGPEKFKQNHRQIFGRSRLAGVPQNNYQVNRGQL